MTLLFEFLVCMLGIMNVWIHVAHHLASFPLFKLSKFHNWPLYSQSWNPFNSNLSPSSYSTTCHQTCFDHDIQSSFLKTHCQGTKQPFLASSFLSANVLSARTFTTSITMTFITQVYPLKAISFPSFPSRSLQHIGLDIAWWINDDLTQIHDGDDYAMLAPQPSSAFSNMKRNIWPIHSFYAFLIHLRKPCRHPPSLEYLPQTHNWITTTLFLVLCTTLTSNHASLYHVLPCTYICTSLQVLHLRLSTSFSITTGIRNFLPMILAAHWLVTSTLDLITLIALLQTSVLIPFPSSTGTFCHHLAMLNSPWLHHRIIQLLIPLNHYFDI